MRTHSKRKNVKYWHVSGRYLNSLMLYVYRQSSFRCPENCVLLSNWKF